MAGARTNRADDVLLVDATKTTQGAFAVDAHLRIVFWNAAAEALLGYTEAEVLGRRCSEVFNACHGAAPDGCMRQCGTAAKASGVQLARRFTLAAMARNGAITPLAVLALVAHNALGEPRLMHLLRAPGMGTADAEARQEAHPGQERTANGHAHMAGVDGAEPAQPLTKREHEVLRLLARGLTTPEIADELSISPITARNHVTSVIEKLGVRTRLQAVVMASRRGLL